MMMIYLKFIIKMVKIYLEIYNLKIKIDIILIKITKTLK